MIPVVVLVAFVCGFVLGVGLAARRDDGLSVSPESVWWHERRNRDLYGLGKLAWPRISE